MIWLVNLDIESRISNLESRISNLVFRISNLEWSFSAFVYTSIPRYDGTDQMKGMHGYDNADSDMRAIFLASGPGFKKNFVSPPFYNVELYQLMCNILGVNPNPHNGTWSKVSPMLLKAEPERSDHTIMQELWL